MIGAVSRYPSLGIVVEESPLTNRLIKNSIFVGAIGADVIYIGITTNVGSILMQSPKYAFVVVGESAAWWW